MKKILLAFVLAVVALSGISAGKRIKNKIHQEKLGKFKEIEIDSGSFKLKKSFGTDLFNAEYTVKLYGEDGSVGIYYKNDLGSKESLRFDKEARDVLKKACESYLKDYEEKKLKRSKKFVSAYGEARAKIVWKMISDSSTADPKIKFGYCFVGKSPYFCIKSMQSTSDERKGDIVVQHIGITLYFTRAQIKEVVEAMEESRIQEVYSSYMASQNPYADADDYEEAGYEEDSPEEKPKNAKNKKADEESENADYVESE